MNCVVEITRTKLAGIESEQVADESVVRELTELELATIGGGTANVAFL
ncbi:MAG: hypothetical protein MUC86_07970 [Burkholderiaceae bacterium]|jgi:hypothetical protein|nr:hypothetical protein [Burkholderiaceae bacterium]